MRDFEEEIEGLRRGGLYRELRTRSASAGVRCELGGRTLINFASNDYLGMSGHPAVVEAMARGAREHGAGAGASRLISGGTAAHRALEEELAALKGTAAAVSFATGYAAGTGVIGAMVGKGDVVILDKLCHACLVDGARLSGAEMRVFRHNDLDQLRDRLRWAAERAGPEGRILVAVESVYSMDGDTAPLREIVGLKDEVGALLLVDEAHGFGVLGKGGRGWAGELGVSGRVDLQMGTLSKAVGVSGGFVCGSSSAMEVVVNRARSFIFSTAPPPAVAEAARASLQVIAGEEGDALRAKLRSNIAGLRAGIGLGGEAGDLTPIVPIHVGDEAEAMGVSERLGEAGFWVPAVRYPTVARGSARLRATLSALHEAGDIEALVAHLSAGGAEEPSDPPGERA